MSGLYVALGDSMSIDDYAGGPGRGAASLLHRNRDGDFPEWSGRDLTAAGFTAQVLAADGAISTDVIGKQLNGITDAPTLVTLTVGGNDLMVHYGDTAAAYGVIGRVAAATEGVLRRLPPAGECRVVVTTVYDPSDGTGYVADSGLAPWPEG